MAEKLLLFKAAICFFGFQRVLLRWPCGSIHISENTTIQKCCGVLMDVVLWLSGTLSICCNVITLDYAHRSLSNPNTLKQMLCVDKGEHR